MIVSPQEYNSLLHGLMDPNEFTSMLRIPQDEPIYEVDLDARVVKAPEFLSVEEDHNAEIIWFKTDRFYDNIDLYNGNCWILYKNADLEEYFYAAPLIVTVEEYGSDKILIPWAIGKEVTKKTGVIQFSFQFFDLNEEGSRFLYVLNTQPAKSKILTGLQANPTDFEDVEEMTFWEQQFKDLYNKISTLEKDYELYWLDMT